MCSAVHCLMAGTVYSTYTYATLMKQVNAMTWLSTLQVLNADEAATNAEAQAEAEVEAGAEV